MWAVALALVCVRAAAQASQGSCEHIDAIGQELRSQGGSCPPLGSDSSRVRTRRVRTPSAAIARANGYPYGRRAARRSRAAQYRMDAAGHVSHDGHFVLGEGQREWTEQVAMDTQSSTEARTSSSRGSMQRAAGLTVGAVGAASLVAGAVFGALSIAAHDSYEKNCGSNIGVAPGGCSQAGVDGEKDAAMKGTLSTIFFVAGGAAAVAGVVLFVTAPAGVGATVVPRDRRRAADLSGREEGERHARGQSRPDGSCGRSRGARVGLAGTKAAKTRICERLAFARELGPLTRLEHGLARPCAQGPR